jgi:transcriptional regulator with XRE-family HTH domain
MNDERAANAVDRKLGQRVRTRRLEIGMSQERLAELLGVTFQQVQKYEKGINRIAASRLFDISSALDMPVSRFFEGLIGRGAQGVAESSKDYIDDALATPEGAQLMALFASIKSVKVRRRVIELVRALTEEAADTKR